MRDNPIGISESSSIAMPRSQRRRLLVHHDDFRQSIAIQIRQRGRALAVNSILENAGAFLKFRFFRRQPAPVGALALRFRYASAKWLAVPRPRQYMPPEIGHDHFHLSISKHISQRRRRERFQTY